MTVIFGFLVYSGQLYSTSQSFMWFGHRTCNQQVASSTLAMCCRVCTWMGDCLWVCKTKPSRYVTNRQCPPSNTNRLVGLDEWVL